MFVAIKTFNPLVKDGSREIEINLNHITTIEDYDTFIRIRLVDGQWFDVQMSRSVFKATYKI